MQYTDDYYTDDFSDGYADGTAVGVATQDFARTLTIIRHADDDAYTSGLYQGVRRKIQQRLARSN